MGERAHRLFLSLNGLNMLTLPFALRYGLHDVARLNDLGELGRLPREEVRVFTAQKRDKEVAKLLELVRQVALARDCRSCEQVNHIFMQEGVNIHWQDPFENF